MTPSGRQPLPAPSVGLSPVTQAMQSSPPWCPQQRPPSHLGAQKGSLHVPHTQWPEKKGPFQVCSLKECYSRAFWGV